MNGSLDNQGEYSSATQLEKIKMQHKIFFFVSVLLVVVLHTISVLANQEGSTPKELFAEFIKKYSKSYHVEEIKNKYANFKNNLKRVDEMNGKYKAIGKTGPFGITKFFDMSSQEFHKMYLNKKTTQRQASPSKIPITPKALPDAFDWSSKGAVTPVYDQGQCGSCWAFSATEAIESAWFLAGNPLVSLSQQQVVDCDKIDLGCEGGDTVTAYQYVINATGLENQANYPYTAEDETCAFSKSKVAASIKSWGYVTQNKNETEMQYGLYANGPLSICVEADSWQYYVGGVISDFCGDALDHCVMITGFQNMQGWDFETYAVWNVRNSWGEDWGVSGYLYIERGQNLCGLAEEVTLPVV